MPHRRTGPIRDVAFWPRRSEARAELRQLLPSDGKVARGYPWTRIVYALTAIELPKVINGERLGPSQDGDGLLKGGEARPRIRTRPEGAGAIGPAECAQRARRRRAGMSASWPSAGDPFRTVALPDWAP